MTERGAEEQGRIINPQCPLALSVRVASRREAEGMPNTQKNAFNLSVQGK
ncbi:hypothetical protein IQ277_05750 [Nostocales cyanobacterium LEGE 12452]|nr:hypothetical protein [Nostocales cyanobacterium LEGE 12452]